ncbi:MAG: hypothetical protein LUC89_09525 [Oscillospiraceae bacterium]|nr:hypothetical protein [Oscillospiraceae bacterium]
MKREFIPPIFSILLMAFFLWMVLGESTTLSSGQTAFLAGLTVLTLGWAVPQLACRFLWLDYMSHEDHLEHRVCRSAYRIMLLIPLLMGFISSSDVGNDMLSLSVQQQDMIVFVMLGVLAVFTLIWILSEFIGRHDFPWGIPRLLRGLYQFALVGIIEMMASLLIGSSLYETSEKLYKVFRGAAPVLLGIFVFVAFFSIVSAMPGKVGTTSEEPSDADQIAAVMFGAAYADHKIRQAESDAAWAAEQADRAAKEAIQARAYEKYGTRGQVNRDNTAWRPDDSSDWQNKL